VAGSSFLFDGHIIHIRVIVGIFAVFIEFFRDILILILLILLLFLIVIIIINRRLV
jgi:ABC-type multidrug transport system fused ATPase/permease subunit